MHMDNRHTKERLVMERLGRRDDSDRAFDQEFWQVAGHEARFAAMWDMIAQVARIREKNVESIRLQRSVELIRERAR